MSYGLVPGPIDLLTSKRATAEAHLHINSAATDLYEWSEDILNELVARGDSNPKLTLANSLDIPYEDYWMAYVSAPRSTPRHRVIARFAREKLWDQIWSLNWDCVQENAFESVGIVRDGVDAGMPWPTVFRWFVTAADCAAIAEDNSVKIIKPHGCVMALVKAEEAESHGDHEHALQLANRFLVTRSELANLAPTPGTQQFIFATLCNKLSSLPFVTVGWSASERYLLDYIEQQIAPSLAAQTLAVDELSVVDINFNNDGHTRLAGFYGKDASSAHIRVEPPTLDLDGLFLWVQGLYGVTSLISWSDGRDRDTLNQIKDQLLQPPADRPFVLRWIDIFLPVWVRLCWRCGLISCRDEAQQPIRSDDIKLDKPDEHIPWVLKYIERPELQCAATLLAALYRSGDGNNWNVEKYPGGFYKDQLLVVPLPSWQDIIPNDLRGLKTLIDALKTHGAGYIDEVRVLFLADEATAIPDSRKQMLKDLVARDLALVRFAKASDIGEIRLEDL